jgi:glutamate synthase domain-containing protein 1
MKLTIQSDAPEQDFAGLQAALSEALGHKIAISVVDTHAVLLIDAPSVAKAREVLRQIRPSVRIMSSGGCLEIYKEVGLPKNVAQRYNLRAISENHSISHTQMATESAVTTMGASV